VAIAGVDASGQVIRSDNAGDIRGREFLPNTQGRKTTKRSARPAVPGDNVWPRPAVWVTDYVNLTASTVPVVGSGSGNSRNVALTQDSLAIVWLGAKTPGARHSVGGHEPDLRTPGITHGVGTGVNGTKRIHIRKAGRCGHCYRRSREHAHCAENDGCSCRKYHRFSCHCGPSAAHHRSNCRPTIPIGSPSPARYPGRPETSPREKV
jgi:hypothetical protein